MSEVKRYVFTWSETRGGYNCPDASAAGLPMVLASDYAALQAERDGLVRALRECEAYLADREDVVDGSYGEPAPNKEMTLLIEVRSALRALAALEGK